MKATTLPIVSFAVLSVAAAGLGFTAESAQQKYSLVSPGGIKFADLQR